MDVRSSREAAGREPFDPRDLEISRLKREVAMLRGREASARIEAQDARKHFADLTSMSKRFAHSMRATVGERQQQRRRLAAQYAVSRVLAEARDLDEAAPKIYEVLGERLGWQAGALWKIGEDSDGFRVLRRTGFWRSGGSPTGALEAAGEGTVCRRGEGLPGRVWERCEPVWVEDLFTEENMPRKYAAAEDGPRGALAFPIVDGVFVGVFELFRREVLPPDEDLMRTAGLVGGQISQFLERRHAEEERDRALVRERAAHEQTAGILESINDAFFTLDRERRFFYVNSKTEELLGTMRGELLGRKIWEVYPEAFGSESYRATEEALKDGKAAEFETVSPILGIWISVRVYPSADGVSVLFHSIEERKRAEEAEGDRDRSREREREARDAAEEAERRLAFYAGAREERQIISRDLHDRVAHSIAVVRQNLELYEVLKDRNPEAAAKKMDLAKSEAKASLKSTRDLSMMLRRSEVEGGLANALAGLEETTVPMGVCYGSSVKGDVSLVPPHVGNQVFLVLREAVRNAVNHSGCGRVEVRLEITEEGVIGTVEDDGRGFEPGAAYGGGGLRSMEERASLVGGTFGLRSTPDGGMKVEVSVPLRKTDA